MMFLLEDTYKWLFTSDLKLFLECPTKWNSFLIALSSVHYLMTPLNVLHFSLKSDDIIITVQEVTQMKEIKQKLENFKDISEYLQGNSTSGYTS